MMCVVLNGLRESCTNQWPNKRKKKTTKYANTDQSAIVKKKKHIQKKFQLFAFIFVVFFSSHFIPCLLNSFWETNTNSKNYNNMTWKLLANPIRAVSNLH